MNRIHRLLDAWKGRASERRKRGPRRQRRRREAERSIRMSALAYLRWGLRRGMSFVEVGDRLGIEPSTLGVWRRRWKDDHLRPVERGRRTEAVDREQRESFLAIFGLMGPQVGLPTLQSLFPEMARSAILDLQRRCREIYLRRKVWIVHALRWTRAGSVWAIDFTDPPAAIEGLYPKLLVVRDLASGYALLAIPAMAATATLVVRILESLFKWFGPPLVLKSDNGGPFVDASVKALLARHRVQALYSPEGTPSYNGAVEAGIGSIKVRALWHAASEDRPGEWTCDDIEAAVRQANETGRPRGLGSPTPQTAWLWRIPITEAERERFLETCARHASAEYTQRGLAPMTELQHRERASIDRVAISRALIELGFLLIRRRRITPPVSIFRQRKIS